jgi:hypothetical protein
MPPNSPPAALSEMRSAFVALGKDQSFLAEYEKVIGERLDLVSAQDAQIILGQLKQTSPEIVARIKDRVEKR